VVAVPSDAAIADEGHVKIQDSPAELIYWVVLVKRMNARDQFHHPNTFWRVTCHHLLFFMQPPNGCLRGAADPTR
jgi:hypothetical protein